MTRHLLRAAEFPLTLTMVLLASVAWTRGYADPRLGILLGIAAALSVGIPHVYARILHRSFVYSLTTSIVAYLLFTLAFVVQKPLGFADLGRGLSDGIAQLLSNTLPLNGEGWIVVVPVTACWVTGAAVGELAARTRSVGLPVVVAFVGFAASYGATVGGLGDENGWAALLLLNAGALLFVRRWINDHPTESGRVAADATARDRAGLRPLAFGSATLGIAALVCLALVPNVSSLQGEPIAPNREPPELQSIVVTPIADVAALRRESDPGTTGHTLFDITLTRDAPGYIAVAQLDEYDGDKWTYDRVFVPTGGRIPGGEGPEHDQTASVEAAVSIHSPEFARHDWLPTVGRPLSVDGVAVRYDPASATLVPAEDVNPGTSYRVRSRIAATTFSRLPTDGSVSFDTTAGSSPVPDALGDHLDAWLRLIEKERNLPIHATPEFFRGVEAHLKDSKNYGRIDDRPGATVPTTVPSTTTPPDPAAPAPETTATTAPPKLNEPTGTSFAEIEEALLGTSSSGTPEQFATLFAALVQRKNIPARVVTGFRIAPPDRVDGMVPSGHYEVSSSQAWTWVEVPVIGHGWVVVDPTPDNTSPPQKDDTNVSESTTTTVAAPTTTAVQVIVVGSAPPPSTVPTGTADRPGVLIAIAVIAIPTVIAGALLALLLIRTRRRAKRRASVSPVDRTIGAWHEALDILYEADLRDLEACTSTEVSQAANDRFGEQVARPVMQIGTFANEAIFYTSGLPPEHVDRAWTEFDTMRAALREQQSGKERLRTFLRVSPRATTHARHRSADDN